LAWLADLRPHISRQAFSGYMGWHAAKSIWPTSRWRAIRYYLAALLNGAYGPRLAGAVLMQIVLPDSVYRQMCDRWIDFTQLFSRRRQEL